MPAPDLCLRLCAASLSLMLAGAVLAADDRPPPPDGPHGHRPQPEAIAACAGKPEGVRVNFTGRRGETLWGVCVRMGDVLAARPERPPGPPPEGREPPPR